VKPVTIEVRTGRRTDLVEVTGLVREAARGAGAAAGVVHCFVPHTTAAVTLGERVDPQVGADLMAHLERLAPWAGPWTHAVNAAAHVRASIVGSSVSVPWGDGDLQLGSWQGIFLCEFHGPRARTMRLTFLPSA
jgi:secondary thiamine-phosphate synthase enzyme